MDRTFKQVLGKIGLSKQEIEIYTIALEYGQMSIGKFAKKTTINRPNLYKIMESLEVKGLGSFSNKNKYKRQFAAQSPSVVYEILQQQINKEVDLQKDFKQMMPDLMMLFKQGSSQTRVKTLFGREEFLWTFDQIIAEGAKETYFCGSFQDFVTFSSWEKQQDFVKKRIKNNIKAYGLVFADRESKLIYDNQKEQLRETRFLSKDNFFHTAFQIFGNKVIIWQPKTPTAILIEDEYISKMFLNIFQMLWSSAKK